MERQRRPKLEKEWFSVVFLAASVVISLRSTSAISSSDRIVAGALRSSDLLWPAPAATLCAKETVVASKDKETHFPYRWVMERHSESPVLCAIPGTWEAQWFVVGDVLRMDGKYYMYYCSSVKGNKNSRLGLAISSDGVKWERYPDNPI